MHSSFTDQLSRNIILSGIPQRIISLVPSQTELLFDLGLSDRIIGVTKFCVHPIGSVKSKIKVGGTKKLNIDLIRKLKPDLVIGNKEENEQNQIETLMQEFPVWMSDIADLPGALTMIRGIGSLTHTEEKAEEIVSEIQKNFNSLPQIVKTISVAYLIWQGPYMVAASGTFIDDMLQRCGFDNVFKQQRYPVVTAHDLQLAKPDVIMLSSEPYPFKQKHIEACETLAPGAKVILVDGEMFSWYGSRMLLAAQYFEQLIVKFNGESW